MVSLGGKKMRIEEIALRQEARQMLCEAGLSKEELKIIEEVRRECEAQNKTSAT